MGQGQGPPEQPGATHSPQGEHGEDCEDGRSAPLTLTQPDPAQRLGDDHPERSEASTGRGSTLPAGEAEGARGGKPLALTSNFGPSGPSEIPRSGQAFLDTKNIACYPPKTTLGFYPREVSFWGDIR